MIAMALACDRKLLIADEPTTALDVTIQAQILELRNNLRKTRQLAVLLITHDLGVVAEVADRVAVMYRARSWKRRPWLSYSPVRDIPTRKACCVRYPVDYGACREKRAIGND